MYFDYFPKKKEEKMAQFPYSSIAILKASFPCIGKMSLTFTNVISITHLCNIQALFQL